MDLHSRRSLNIISLCTGGGGLDRALELAIPNSRSVLLVEREAFAVASLVAQIENGLMAPAPIWSDVRTVPGRRFRGLVDGVIGGIPCQEWSLAGQRRGDTGERDLWSPARRTLVQSGAWFCLIENVGGILSAGKGKMPGAERIRRDLHRLGFQVEAVLVRASDVGLPHERERVFILGVNDHLADRHCQHGDWTGIVRPGGGRQSPDGDRELADARCISDQRRGEPDDVLRQTSQIEEDGQERQWRGGAPCDGVDQLAHAGSPGRKGRRSSGDRPGQCAALERGGEFMGDATGLDDQGQREPGSLRGKAGPGEHREPSPEMEHTPGIGWGEGRPEPELRSGWHSAGGPGDELVNTVGGGRDGRSEVQIGRPSRGDVEQLPGAISGREHLSDANGGEPPTVGRDDRQERGLSEGQGGTDDGSALSRGSRPALRPYGPSDADAWRAVAERAPNLLPAVSRYDLFCLALRAQGFAPDGDPSTGAWVDPQTGERVGSDILQAAAQSAFRRVADVMATRIDELRLLGNGVADAQGALAIRTVAHDLATRSTGAAWLVRLMDDINA